MRTVLTGGMVFDGTGAPVAEGDLVIEDGRIVEVGPGLDGDEGVDVSGHSLLPGLFDCHIHLAFRYEDLDEVAVAHRPFSYAFFRIPETLRWILSLGITTVRDASGADAGPRPVGDVARPWGGGHQTGRAGRRPLDRARDVPGRRRG